MIKNSKESINEIEKETEQLLRRDLMVYFSIYDISEEKQLMFLQMMARVMQRIYNDYLNRNME